MRNQVVNVLSLGRLNYRSALAVQNSLVNRVRSNVQSGQESGHTLLLVEHPPVYTTGIRTREGAVVGKYGVSEKGVLIFNSWYKE